jgi:hypothetical protein
MSFPSFYKNGQPVTVANFGDTVTFDVPGYRAVWLTQTRNGQEININGPYAVPGPAYPLLYSYNIGIFIDTVYELNPDGSRGVYIGTTTLTVNPPPPDQPARPQDVLPAGTPPPMGVPTGMATSPAPSIAPERWPMIVGVGGFLLALLAFFGRKKG